MDWKRNGAGLDRYGKRRRRRNRVKWMDRVKEMTQLELADLGEPCID